MLTHQPTILVVEDDRKTAELLRLYLERDGYRPLLAADGRTALELIRRTHPALAVVDVMLPKVDGLDICRIVRRESALPIILLTARSTEEDILLGLDLGADDYVTKPFSPRELMARIRTVLRRAAPVLPAAEAGDQPWLRAPAEPAPRPPLRFGALVVDPTRHEASLAGHPLPLTPKEFKLLLALCAHPGRAFTRGELLARVFGGDYPGLERTVDAHIMNLRRKLEPDAANPTYIETVYGVGYRFAAPAAPEPGARLSFAFRRREAAFGND